MLVHLLRHGVAADTSPSGLDDDRPLTDQGRDKLNQSAAAFRVALSDGLERVVSSPLLRARQTAQLIYKEAHLEDFASEIEESDDLVHSVSADRAVTTIIEPSLAEGCRGILLVGHEPHLGDLFGQLVNGRASSLPLRKGMLVGIELAGRTSTFGRMLYALPTRLARPLSAQQG